MLVNNWSSENNTENSSNHEDTDNSINTTSNSSDYDEDDDTNLELLGKTLRHYNVIYELGKGGYSRVWLVYNKLDKKFYALKVQDPNNYDDGLKEIYFVKKLPKEPKVFNNLIEYFIEIHIDKKYLCSVWNLHVSNLDTIIRKAEYKLSYNIVVNIMKQLIVALNILHNKFKVFHGDIKTDNILIKGISNKNKIICDKYSELYNGTNHYEITNIILDDTEDLCPYEFDFNNEIQISLADFGFFCDEDSEYESSFGTRYYQAPEIILMGECSYPVDIWALGCTFFELITGTILFDPIKDSNNTRDYYHLCLINETCGKFSSSFLNKTKYYEDYFNSKNEIFDFKVNNFNRLDRKLEIIKNDYSEEQLNIIKDIIKKILVIDSKRRPNIKEIKNIFNNL
jgi:serine/threonine-protein kinase SRPK3